MPGPERVQRCAEAVAEPVHELLELRHLQDVRLFVNAIEGGRLLRFEVGRHRLVRQEHELLDEPVRHVPPQRDDGFDHAAFVDDDLGFVQIEVDRAAPPASIVEHLEQLSHQLEGR